MSITLTFKTEVLASKEKTWEWITSVDGISKELSPLLKMTTPKNVSDISSVEINTGEPLFVSIVLLFGFFPIDYSKLTLLKIDIGEGFIEQSPMGSMKVWRHERSIFSKEKGCEVKDVLNFQPRFFSSLLCVFVKQLFNHRHRMLGKYLGKA